MELEKQKSDNDKHRRSNDASSNSIDETDFSSFTHSSLVEEHRFKIEQIFCGNPKTKAKKMDPDPIPGSIKCVFLTGCNVFFLAAV